jgi:photosystem II stability/assembly factor-like uncharacterized protein
VSATLRSTALAVALAGLAGLLLAQERPQPTPTPAPGSAGVVTSLTVFAGTPEGLYRSRDWGSTWQAAIGSNGKTYGLDGVGAVRDVLPLGPQVFLAGNGGVYQSDDFGETWRRTETGAPVVRVLPSRYPLSDPTVFAATTGGLLKSKDGGRTFGPTLLADMNVTRLEWPGPALVVATSRGVFVSPDSGVTFTRSESGLPEGEVRALAVSSFFASDPVMFAGVGATGVHRSSDGGRTWTKAGLPGQNVTDLAWLGPFLYAVAESGLFRSEDLGRNWEPLTRKVASAPTRVLFPLMPASGSEIFLGTVDGMYRSPDGGLNWQASGLDGLPILCLATFPAPEPRRK